MKQNFELLRENKNEYISHLNDLLVAPFVKEMILMYQSVENSSHALKEFQSLLANIKNMNHIQIKSLFKRVIPKECDYFQELLKATLTIFVKINLLSRDDYNDSMKIKVRFPTSENFVHSCLVAVARNVWKKPYILYHQVRTIERQHNLNQLEEIIKASILYAIRNSLPIQDMLPISLDEESESEIDLDAEDDDDDEAIDEEDDEEAIEEDDDEEDDDEEDDDEEDDDEEDDDEEDDDEEDDEEEDDDEEDDDEEDDDEEEAAVEEEEAADEEAAVEEAAVEEEAVEEAAVEEAAVEEAAVEEATVEEEAVEEEAVEEEAVEEEAVEEEAVEIIIPETPATIAVTSKEINLEDDFSSSRQRRSRKKKVSDAFF